MAYLGRVKHDLGKYIAFQQRWLAPEASAAERRDAVTADLLETRRGPDGTSDAVAVWRELRAPLIGAAPLPGGAVVDLSGDPDVARIDREMARVARVVDAIAAGAADDALLAEGARAALEVSDACAALVRRHRAGSR